MTCSNWTLLGVTPALVVALGGCLLPSAKTEARETTPAAAAGATAIPPQPGASLSPLFDELDAPNLKDWAISDGYTNGPLFHCGWRKENVLFEGGKLKLRMDTEGCPAKCSGKPYGAGEYQSVKRYGYGRYEARMKPGKLSGTMSASIFTYNANPQDEIDIEFLGKDTTSFQTNYFTNGVGQHSTDIQLGFDATEAFHDYAFEWRPDSITWFVDGKPVHREDGSRGPLPQAAGAFVLNMWPGHTVDSWLGPLKYEGKPVQAEYEWARFTPLAELTAENTAALSIQKPPGAVPQFEGKSWLVDDFEAGATAKTGGTWMAEMDSHKLGTQISPKPFVASAGGAPGSPAHAGHISGHLGPSREPWPYAVLALDLMSPARPVDLRGFSSLELWAKGDEREYRLQLPKASVSDWGHPQLLFKAPKAWTRLTLPLTKLAQPDWAKKVEASLQDVTAITFGAVEGDKDFDLWIDDIRFLK